MSLSTVELSVLKYVPLSMDIPTHFNLNIKIHEYNTHVAASSFPAKTGIVTVNSFHGINSAQSE